MERPIEPLDPEAYVEIIQSKIVYRLILKQTLIHTLEWHSLIFINHIVEHHEEECQYTKSACQSEETSNEGLYSGRIVVVEGHLGAVDVWPFNESWECFDKGH